MHIDNESLDDDGEFNYPSEANDVFDPSEVKSIWDKLTEITPLESKQEWPSKSTRKDLAKNEARYDAECT